MMKLKAQRLAAAIATVFCCECSSLAAEINYIAENGGGEYNGAGYGISVSVSAPADGYSVQFAESENGPWGESVTYKDVCSRKAVWFKIEAEGYSTVTDSRTVTITPKTLTSDYVWLVLPSEDYIYDGTAKEPDVAFGDGEPSIISRNDFDVVFSDNLNAGTATALFTGKGNYTGEVEEEFEILKADNEWTTEPAIANWTYGQTPSEPSFAAKDGNPTVTYNTSDGNRPTLPGTYSATFAVPESANYNELSKTLEFTISPATINYIAENGGGEYNGAGYGISVSVSAPADGYSVQFAESENGPWGESVTYKDVCSRKAVWFKIEAEGYSTVTDSRTVTITPKTLTSDYVWLVLPSEDYIYDGTAKEPDVAFGDGEPSIISRNDFDVVFSDNLNAGTATALFTGKGNYTGEVEEEFEILKADNEWTTEPVIADWTYGQTPSEPSFAAKDGNSTVTYNTTDGNRPTLPGTYSATFAVPESANYNELSTTLEFTISPATINYIAENGGGEYNGAGYGISVSVSAPADGYSVQYAESENGPWGESVTYKDVCSRKAVWFKIEAEGYSTVTDSRTVTITPKTLTSDYVWLVLPSEDYVYDGTAKEPDVAFGNGEPSIISRNDFDVVFSDNLNAGTATALFTGKGNYTGEVTEEFEIRKASLSGGDEPGDGQVSKFDVSETYDGNEHTVDTNALTAAFQSLYDGAAIDYALEASAAEWSQEPAAFVNAGVTSIWYKVSLANYDDFIHEVKITIAPRDIALATIDEIAETTYAGSPVEPEPVVSDGSPSIITADDYTVEYSDNNAPGTASLTLTGKNNYTGTKTVSFTILAAASDAAELSAEIAWTYCKATGTYFAQLAITCTEGLDAGISGLRYLFADRIGDDGQPNVQLWSTLNRSANSSTTTYEGETYRYVDLDESLIAAENTPAVFGVTDTSAESIPVEERTIEMYVQKRVVPQTGNEGAAKVGDFVGYVCWQSGGETHAVPVVAGGSALSAPLSAMRSLAAPLSVSKLNVSLAVGTPVAAQAKPYCRIASFSVEKDVLRGSVETGSQTQDGAETKGALGGNVRVKVLGAASLAAEFEELAIVEPDFDGNFSLARPEGYQFFKLSLDVVEIVK